MNFKWEKIAERGQYATGFIEVFELKSDKRALTTIYYLPQHTDVQQRVILTLILEGDRGEWTSGTIDSIFEDVENRIKDMEWQKFNNYNFLDYIDVQIFTVDSISNFSYFSHGDQAIKK